MQWLREYRARKKAHKVMSKMGWSQSEVNDWINNMKDAKTQLDESIPKNVQLFSTLETVRDGNATREMKANISLGLIDKADIADDVKLEFINWIEEEYKDLLIDEAAPAKES